MSEDKPKPLDKPPTSKLGRLARLAGLAPRAIPFAVAGAKRALGGARTEAQDAAAHEQMGVDVKKAAAAMLKTFGEMKGLPLKFGQMASYIDGIAPPGHEERAFKPSLKKLLDKAPPLSPEAAAISMVHERARRAARRGVRRVGSRALRRGQHRPGPPRGDEGWREGCRQGAIPGDGQGDRERFEERRAPRNDDVADHQEAQRPADDRRVSRRLPERARLRPRGRDGRPLPPPDRGGARGSRSLESTTRSPPAESSRSSTSRG